MKDVMEGGGQVEKAQKNRGLWSQIEIQLHVTVVPCPRALRWALEPHCPPCLSKMGHLVLDNGELRLPNVNNDVFLTDAFLKRQRVRN